MTQDANTDILKLRGEMRNMAKAKIKKYLQGHTIRCSRCGIPTGHKGVTMKKIANSDKYICSLCTR